MISKKYILTALVSVMVLSSVVSAEISSDNTNPNTYSALNQMSRTVFQRAVVRNLPVIKEAYISDVNDAGLYFTVVFDSNMTVNELNIPFWRRGNYKIMKSKMGTRVAPNTFKTYFSFEEIGGGSDYVFFGIHPYLSDGNTHFVKDVAFKLDTTIPEVTINQSDYNWTNKDITLSAVGTDDFNIIETIKFHKGSTLESTKEVYSEPKILLVNGYTGDSYIAQSSLKDKKNITIIPRADLHSMTVSQLTNYDVVVYDGTYFSIDENSAKKLNDAFNQGVSIITNCNDSPSPSTPVSGIDCTGGNYTFNIYDTDPTGFYKQGKISRFAELMNGITEYDSGYWRITPNSQYAYVVSELTHASGVGKSPGVVMQTHANGNKWIHIQGFEAIGSSGGYLRAVDEIMHGKMKTRQTYTSEYTVSENGTYYVEMIDFSGNSNKKKIVVSNIDKDKPTIIVSGMPTAYVQSATLSISCTDKTSGVDYILLPDGTKVYQDNATFTVKENGTYKFTVFDKAGNSSYTTVTINKIDTEIPSATVTVDPTTTTGTVNVYLKDIQAGKSGAKTVQICENKDFSKNVVTADITGLTSKTVPFTLEKLNPIETNYKVRPIYVKVISASGVSKVYSLSTEYLPTSPVITFIKPAKDNLFVMRELIYIKWSIKEGSLPITKATLTIHGDGNNYRKVIDITGNEDEYSILLPEGKYKYYIECTDTLNNVTKSEIRNFRVYTFKTDGRVGSITIQPKNSIRKIAVQTEVSIPEGTSIEGRIYYEVDEKGQFTSKYITFDMDSYNSPLQILHLPSKTTKIKVVYELHTTLENFSPILDGFKVYAR